MKRLIPIAILVAACTGGGGQAAADPTQRPTPAPAWPEFWDQEFCYALDQIGDANGHIRAAGEAAGVFDLDGAIEEATQAATDAGEAVDALEVAEAWAPAHSAIVYLSSTAEELQKAANLVVLAMEDVDASLVEEALKHQDKAAYQLGRANTSIDALTAKYGPPC